MVTNSFFEAYNIIFIEDLKDVIKSYENDIIGFKETIGDHEAKIAQLENSK